MPKVKKNEIEKVLAKLIFGVLKGTNLTKNECRTLIRYMNMRDEVIKQLVGED